jgi:hypothetical protein
VVTPILGCRFAHPGYRRLQNAVARVLPAIESIAGKLASTHTHPREMERAVRALAALTRTLRELDSQLRRQA